MSEQIPESLKMEVFENEHYIKAAKFLLRMIYSKMDALCIGVSSDEILSFPPTLLMNREVVFLDEEEQFGEAIIYPAIPIYYRAGSNEPLLAEVNFQQLFSPTDIAYQKRYEITRDRKSVV